MNDKVHFNRYHRGKVDGQSKKKQHAGDDDGDDLTKNDDLSEDLNNYNEIIDQLCAGDDNDEDDFDDEDDDEGDDLDLSDSLKVARKKSREANLNESVVELLANFSMRSKDFEMYRNLQFGGGSASAVNNASSAAAAAVDGENDIDEENMFAENDIENSIQQHIAIGDNAGKWRFLSRN